jgi:hypothetical protein
VKDLQSNFKEAGFDLHVRALNSFYDDYGLREYEIEDESDDDADGESDAQDDDPESQE